MILDLQEQKRALDYVKAIGIISVVVGHFPNSIFNIMTPYMYHMPLFFFIGGVVFKEKNWLNLSLVILRKFVLYVIATYIIIGSLTVLLKTHFGFINLPEPFNETISNTIHQTLTQNFHNNSLFLVAWFLVAYMAAMIMLNAICKMMALIGLNKYKIVLTITGVASGWIAIDFISVEYKSTGNILLNYLGEFLVAFMFMSLGKCISFNAFKYMSTSNAIVFFVIIVTLKYAGIASDIGMSWSIYPNGFINTIIQVFLCIYIVFYISSALSKSTNSKVLTLLGKSTKPIMSYHILVFFIVDIILQWISVGDYTASTAFSGHNQQAPYWALYIVSALIIPSLSSVLFNKIKSFFTAGMTSIKAP
ncbi:acyltransferase family protein [Escherichia coli]|uniref:acyltransferase family protein n=1 Tax=Escherichia coli TaxID=562 RepID=UPI001F4CD664|nr:acyltransferase family protein [Escherichia coli]MCH8585759.1 acyltransferase family protein [Escherichia coli]